LKYHLLFGGFGMIAKILHGKIYWILGFLLTISAVFGVGETGAIFLLISPSPTLNGMGGVGTGLPVEDIFSVYYNPANTFVPMGTSYFQVDNSTRWLPNLSDHMYLKSHIRKVTYRSQDTPIYLSLTQFRSHLDLDPFYFTDENGYVEGFRHLDYHISAISYAAGIDFNHIPLRISIGRTNKRVKEDFLLPDSSFIAENTLYDLGILISAPLRLDKKRRSFNFLLTPSVGYSHLNRGGDIHYGDEVDPAPRMARFGASVTLNMSYHNRVKFISYTFAREAGDILFKVGQTDILQPPFDYQTGLGDIDIKKHIIQGTADSSVTLYQGQELVLWNSIFIRKGKMTDIAGHLDSQYTGWGLNLAGFLNAWAYVSDDRKYSDLAKHINIRYNYSIESSLYSSEYPRDGTVYRDLTLVIHNPQKLVPYLKRNSLTIFTGKTYSTIDNRSLGSQKTMPGKAYGVELSGSSQKFEFVTGLSYSGMGFKAREQLFGDYQTELAFELNYLRIYLQKLFQLENIDFRTGPELGYILSAKVKARSCITDECYNISNSISSAEWESDYRGNLLDAGWSAEVRLAPKASFSLGINYYYGFSNVLKTTDGVNKSLRSVFYWNL